MIYDTAKRSVQSVCITLLTRDRALGSGVSGGMSIYTEKIQSCTHTDPGRNTASAGGATGTDIYTGVPSAGKT